MDYNFLKTSCENGICVLTVSAPKSLNALNSALLKEMGDFLSHIDKEVRVLIITGDGEKSFVAGADISEMQNLNALEGEVFGRLGAQVFRKIETLDIPVIAAVNGFALGGGCELAMACDIRICSENAKFGQPEVGLGIIPGFSGTYRLAKLVGMGYAKEMIYTGKAIRADEALRIGLVNAVYPQAELMDQAMAMACSLCQAVHQRRVRPRRRCRHCVRERDVRQVLRHPGPKRGHDRLPHQGETRLQKRIILKSTN